MAEYDNSGILSRNDYKKEDKHPDYKGDATIDGKKVVIAGWIRERKDGSGKYMSLKFSEPKDSPKPSAASTEEVPF